MYPADFYTNMLLFEDNKFIQDLALFTQTHDYTEREGKISFKYYSCMRICLKGTYYGLRKKTYKQIVSP